jgi:putative tryptophan/tyrosine transport system substrate-binding protein
MKRREFIAVLGGAAVWPLTALAQQMMPVIGFLNSGAPEAFAPFVTAFLAGLQDAGYVEGQNVIIEYRWARNQYDRLPTLASELVERRVGVIVATGSSLTPQAVKAATTTIPVVFVTGYDPVSAGLVANLGRPSGNLTGTTFFTSTLVPKRIALLHELLPGASAVGLLMGPGHLLEGAETRTGAEAAARAIGIEVRVFSVGSADDLDRVFATVAEQRIGAIVLSSEPFWIGQGEGVVALAARYAIPTIGGAGLARGLLMSYSTSIADAYRNVGLYAGKILHGAKPADLPVVQPVRFQLVINLKTAKALGLTFPPTLLATADEVIE